MPSGWKCDLLFKNKIKELITKYGDDHAKIVKEIMGMCGVGEAQAQHNLQAIKMELKILQKPNLNLVSQETLVKKLTPTMLLEVSKFAEDKQQEVLEKINNGELNTVKDVKIFRESGVQNCTLSTRYLNKSGVEWCDYSINIYKGCSHNCSYCYAKAMHGRDTLWKGQIEAWNKPLKREIDLEELKKELEKADKGRIFYCSATDAYQPLNKKLGWSREVLEVLGKSKHEIYVLTKNASIEDDFDLISKHRNIQVGFTLTSLDDIKYKTFEPGSSPPSERIRVLKKAHDMGISTRVSLEPWIPKITDPFEIVKQCHSFIDYWWIGSYNYTAVKLEWYTPYVGKLQSLFVELRAKYWFKAELTRAFKSTPILNRVEFREAEGKLVGDQ